MSGRVLHSGAVLAIAQGSIYMASMLRWADDNDIVLAIPAGALAEAARQAGDDMYRLHLALTVEAVRVLALDEQAALTTGELCATTGTSDLTAAHSAWIASAQQWAVVAAEADAAMLRSVLPDVELEFVP